MFDWDQREDPTQERVREWFQRVGSGQWMPLYGSFGGDGWRGGILAALAPVDYRPTAVGKPAWDLFHGTYSPGFSTGYEGDDLVTEYVRLSSQPVEPIVIERGFDGVRPAIANWPRSFGSTTTSSTNLVCRRT